MNSGIARDCWPAGVCSGVVAGRGASRACPATTQLLLCWSPAAQIKHATARLPAQRPTTSLNLRPWHCCPPPTPASAALAWLLLVLTLLLQGGWWAVLRDAKHGCRARLLACLPAAATLLPLLLATTTAARCSLSPVFTRALHFRPAGARLNVRL
jgi:hypothetical protein